CTAATASSSRWKAKSARARTRTSGKRPDMFTVLIDAPGRDTRQVRCMHRECGIGRGDANLVMLQGWNIASKHATLVREDTGVFSRPLGGKDPIILNGKAVLAKQGPISGRDELRIGNYTLKVSGDDSGGMRVPPAANDQEPAPAPRPVDAAAERSTSTEITLAGPGPSDLTTWRTRLHIALVRQMDLRRKTVRTQDDQTMRDTPLNLSAHIFHRVHQAP